MAERDKRVAYQLKVRGKLDERWSDWFSGLRVVVESESPPINTSIGLIDQAGRRGSAQRISSPRIGGGQNAVVEKLAGKRNSAAHANGAHPIDVA